MKLKNIFIILLMALVAAALLLGGFVYTVIHEAKPELSKLGLREREDTAKPSVIEQASLVKKEDLKTFYTFTVGELSFSDWYAAAIEANRLVDEGSGNLSVKESIELPPLVTNDCTEPYCFQHVIGFEKIPSQLWKGLIGIEDLRFVNHAGIDFKSILRALVVDLKEMRMAQGGSTITQQLIKNLFLTQEKSILRKLKEIILSIYIEHLFEKEEILTTYFNEVFWGAVQGIRIKGVYAASLLYFQKKPDELSDYETTILVSLLKGPNFYSPITKWERLKNRSDMVYEKLIELNLFAKNYDEKWKIKDWELWNAKLKRDQTNRLIHSLWMSQEDKETVFDPYERYVFMKSGQRVLERIKNLDKKEDDLAFKAIVLDPFCKECRQPQYFYSKIERDKVKAIEGENHQVGSVLKPILYDIFYRLGKSPRDLVETKPLTLKLKSGPWSPRESSKVITPVISLEEALQKSKNIPLIRTAFEVGIDHVESNLLDYIPTIATPLAEYPAQMLGSIELSLKELSEIYKKFLNTQCQEFKSEEKSFEELVIAQLSDPTKSTLAGSVDSKLAQMKFFGKTGTTNNGLDNWLVVFDGRLLSIIWFGVEGNRVGKTYPMSGSSSSFKIFQEFANSRGKRFDNVSCENYKP